MTAQVVNCPDEYWDVFCGRGSRWMPPSGVRPEAHWRALRQSKQLSDTECRRYRNARLGCFFGLKEQTVVRAFARFLESECRKLEEAAELIG